MIVKKDEDKNNSDTTADMFRRLLTECLRSLSTCSLSANTGNIKGFVNPTPKINWLQI